MRLRRPFLDLDGAVVVVTGASSGIGRLTARHLAARGARLVLAARDSGSLADAVAECNDAGGEAIAVVTDVSDPDAVAALVEAAERRVGPIDAWINNAGVMAYGRYDMVPMAAHHQVIATNLLGPMYAASEVLPRFRERERGVLVNVGSLYGEMTTPYVSSYVTSKFGMLGWSRVLQRELRPVPGIRVCCVMPGSIDTPIFRHAANYMGRPVRGIPPAADPARVARVIVGCLEHPQREVRVGWASRMVAVAEKVVPPVYDRIVDRAMQTVGFRSGEIDPSDGNLYEPTPEWYQVDGEWRRTGIRRGLVAAGAAALLGGAAAAALRSGRTPL